MTESQRRGNCTAYPKGGNDDYAMFAPEEYQVLRSSWESGKAFFTGKDMHGSEQTIKLADVWRIERVTPEQWVARNAETQEAKISGDID